MKVPLQAITTVLLLALPLAAQNPAAEIQNLNVARSGDAWNVEVTLSEPVSPNVVVATGPDRLVLELPNTFSSARQRHVQVNHDGIKDLRIGLHSANPPVTRVVIDLSSARPYRVSTKGNTIILAILPPEKVAHERKSAPVPAASAPIWGRLKPHKAEPVPTRSDESNAESETIVPPKPFPPIQLPDGSTVPSRTAAVSNAKPTAAHPNYGSLQQGTVFPNAGEPGTGYVPAGSNAGAEQPAKDASTTAAVANASAPDSSSTQTIVTTAVVARMGRTATASDSRVDGTVPSTAPGQPSPAQLQSTTGASPGESSASAQISAAAADAASVQAGRGARLHTDTIPTAPVVEPTIAVRPYPALVAPTGPPVEVAAALSPTAPVRAVAATPNATPTAPLTTPQTTSVAQSGAAGNAAAVTGNTSPVPSPQPPLPAQAAAQSTSGPVPNSATTIAAAQPMPGAGAAAPAPTAAPDESLPALATRQPNSDIRMGFKVKYVAAGAAYLEGGKNEGLSEGMKLEVRDNLSRADAGSNDAYGPAVAELEVLSVADTSTVAEIHDGAKRDVKPGDWAYLSSEDTQNLVAQRSLSPTRKYPVVVSFTEGTDPLAEEAHAEVPRPPMPDINRARGRFGFDYSTIMSQGGMTSSSVGMSVMTDISRIGGTYWNMTGYWRGRLTSTSANQQQTLQDLINRTYHLGMFYDNPDSVFVAGFGRLYLPYATSLDTIDGGYVGFRVSKVTTLGVFAGSTPDPTSWSYNPQQQIGGTFVNFQGGTFDAVRYSDTFGMGVEMLKWKINRPFVFGENSISFKRFFSVYSAVQADSPAGNQAVTAPGPGLSRSFTTARFQPHKRIEFDLNHTYFRDIPTFDPILIGTGLLDKYLFQGFSAGTRVEVIKDLWLYTTLGRSSRSGDKSASLNQLYGITLGHLPHTKIRTDLHYSKFSSVFGSGSYEAASVSRSFHDNFRWEVLVGRQAYISNLAANDSSKFVTGNLELPLGSHYYIQGGFTANRGGTQTYNQALFSFGYRFDTRSTARSK